MGRGYSCHQVPVPVPAPTPTPTPAIVYLPRLVYLVGRHGLGGRIAHAAATFVLTEVVHRNLYPVPASKRASTQSSPPPSGFFCRLVVASHWPAFHLILGKSRIERGLEVKDLPPKPPLVVHFCWSSLGCDICYLLGRYWFLLVATMDALDLYVSVPVIPCARSAAQGTVRAGRHNIQSSRSHHYRDQASW